MGGTRATPEISVPMRFAILLAVLLCCYPLIPLGPARTTAYDLFGVAAVLVGLWGAQGIGRHARPSWVLLLLGFSGWVVGDLMFSVEQNVWHLSVYPAPSDAVYLLSYVVLAVALLRLVRGARTRRDLTPLLDSAIVAVGFGIVVGTFFVAPIAQDSSLNVVGKLVSSAYPVGDVLLVAVLVRIWTAARGSSAAFRLLLLALVATLVADVVWNGIALVDPDADGPAWLDMLWLLGYLAAAAAACSRSASSLDDRQDEAEVTTSPRRRLLVLGCGLVLPSVTLIIDALTSGDIPWQVVSIGSIALSVLVLARMGLLLHTVEVQAVQLAELARVDDLTGAPNRRTWDHELGRAVQTARQHAAHLCVALIDLDHFKRYNDQHGHQAGDRLLRELVAAWSTRLQPGELLARYGGEEFGLIFPGLTTDQAVARLAAMQAVTPHGQHFSAGLAVYRPTLDAAAMVGLADKALYEAKDAGRGGVRVAENPAEVELPAMRIALQPIVELAARGEVGYEALARFEGSDPESMFARAHREGYGPQLEAAAIAAALRRVPTDGYLSVNVSVGSLLTPAVQAVLPADLRGVVLEITEQTDTHDWDALAAMIEALRRRGAAVAIDDWGKGYSNAERLLRLRPEILKLDRSFLDDLDSAEHQKALEAMVTWAHQVGAKVCAEGIETEHQWHVVLSLGVDLGQGYYFGRPDLDVPTAAVSDAAAAHA